jgi:hypothetical protein
MPPTTPLVFKQSGVGGAPIPNPPAGANFAFTLPEDLIVVSVGLRLVTSAVVANRIMGLTCEDNAGAIFWRCEVNFSQVASSTTDYALYAGGGFDGRLLNAVVDAPMLPATGLVIPQGSVLRSAIAALDAGDQVSAVTILTGR